MHLRWLDDSQTSLRCQSWLLHFLCLLLCEHESNAERGNIWSMLQLAGKFSLIYLERWRPLYKMRLKKLAPLILIFPCLLVSCQHYMPAGFWKDFQKKFLIEDISDQGPYGGHRAMYWKSIRQGTFNAQAILAFAAHHDWKFFDSSKISAHDLAAWHYCRQPIFPLSEEGFDSLCTMNSSIYNYFPRWIASDLTLYRFQTGWVAINPGTAEANQAYGYVIINDNRAEMSVYYLWGE